MDGIFTQIGPLGHLLLFLLWRNRTEPNRDTGENDWMKRNREVVTAIRRVSQRSNCLIDSRQHTPTCGWTPMLSVCVLMLAAAQQRWSDMIWTHLLGCYSPSPCAAYVLLCQACLQWLVKPISWFLPPCSAGIWIRRIWLRGNVSLICVPFRAPVTVSDSPTAYTLQHPATNVSKILDNAFSICLLLLTV